MDSHPWLGLYLAGQVNVKSGISDWNIPNRRGCNNSGDSTNLSCDSWSQNSCMKTSKSNRVVYNDRFSLSLGYLLIYPPQIATVMKLISFCSKYNPVSHTKSLGESQEWNMVFQGNIWSRVKAFKKIYGFAHFGYRRYIPHLIIKQST